MNEGYRWNILALTYLSMLAFAFVFQSIPPILSLIIRELHISHTEAGLLMGLFAVPGIFLSIPGGMLFDRYGTGKIVVVCFILMIIGTLIMVSGRNFFHLASGRVLSGTGALILAIGLPRLVSQWFSGKELGIAMGIFNTAMPMGTIISFTTFGVLAKNLGWQASVSVGGLATLVALIAFLLFHKPAPSPTGRSPGENNIGLLSFKEAGISIWVLGIAWMWFNASTISFITFAPDFFITDKGFSIKFAGFLTSFLMWGSLILSPVVGHLIDKIDSKEILIAVGGLALTIFIFFVPWANTPLIFLMVLIGISVSLIPVSVFSLPADIVKPKSLGFGFGVISTCLSIGMVVGPYFVGLIRDRTGSYQVSFGVMAGFALCVTITMLILLSATSSKS